MNQWKPACWECQFCLKGGAVWNGVVCGNKPAPQVEFFSVMAKNKDARDASQNSKYQPRKKSER
jgi:hypothetical protein